LGRFGAKALGGYIIVRMEKEDVIIRIKRKKRALQSTSSGKRRQSIGAHDIDRKTLWIED